MPEPLSVAIDIRPLAFPGSDGFDYTWHLVHALAFVDPATSFHLFTDRPIDEDLLPHAPNVTVARLDALRRLWKASALAPAAKAAGAHVIHVQGLMPVMPGLPVVTTLRHLGPLTRPRAYRISTGWAWKNILPRQLPTAAAVLVPWRCVRDEVVQRLAVAEERIAVTPYGVETMFSPQCDTVQSEIGKRLGLPPRYVLARLGYDGSVSEAIAIWRRAVAEHGLKASLVIDGEGPAEEGVHPVPAMDARWRPGVISGAVATLLASDDDAAALALLESLATGTPVVGPAHGVLDEIAGKLLSTGDVATQAAALARLGADEDHRTRLMRGGLARAQAFRWPEMAAQTLAAYRAAVGPS